jgi:hypothetical protein
MWPIRTPHARTVVRFAANQLAGASAKAGRRLGYLLTSSEAAIVVVKQIIVVVIKQLYAI